ncbi:hypothetical protein NUW58_g7410 [Xylaria curta]|uniref:Uncharacterized protein n=1 Tax=Xylaria curta TaxID=42375 RepID=A0ACC1NH99_9PEZI|nr:hypothetical protein NUW58_g7410 [Xylaria curta]
MTAPTTQIALKNNTGSSVAYAYVTGLDINKDNAYAFLQPDGKTMYYPQSPSQPQQPCHLSAVLHMRCLPTANLCRQPMITQLDHVYPDTKQDRSKWARH